MDPDHRLLLRSTKPLLQSRNASVVMATSQLYWHLAPKPEIQIVAKALVRLLRSHYEVQSIVLNSIAAMTIQEKGGAKIFQPYLRLFFVRSCDPAHVKILKLEILTNLARPDNISILLREFQSYISGGEKSSVAATIQAIGRCASCIPEVTATCLTGLVQLLSSPEQTVVAESVLEIKKLLQSQQEEHTDIISQMVKLIDTIEVPSARAAVLWVVGEYCQRIPLLAPDVLRKMAKTFCNETDEVKLQVLNLSVKLCLTNPKQTKLLTQYVLNLAKYDMNYDIRDRARYIRAFLFPAPGTDSDRIQQLAKKVFLASKPAPIYESKFKNRQEYQLGSLSHFINAKATGYQDLPEYPDVAPDPSVRNVEPPKSVENPVRKLDLSREAMHRNGGRGGGGDSEEDESGTSDSESSSESSSDDSDQEVLPKKKVVVAKAAPNIKTAHATPTRNERSSVSSKTAVSKKGGAGTNESSSSSDDSDASSESDQEIVAKSKPKSNKDKPTKLAAAVTNPSKKGSAPVSNLDLLLDLDSGPGIGGEGGIMAPAPVLTPSATTPSTGGMESSNGGDLKPMFVSSTSEELLNKISTGGVQVNYRFTRRPHIYAPDMMAIELTFANQNTTEECGEIKVGATRLASGMTIHAFPGILSLAPGQTVSATLGIDFRDTTQPAKFDLVINNRPQAVVLQVPTGEMIRPSRMSENEFSTACAKLRGMNETRGKARIPSNALDTPTLLARVYKAANVLQVPSSDLAMLQFSGVTMCHKHPVLITLQDTSGSGDEQDGSVKEVIVNTENIVIGSMLLKELKTALEQ
eukprot:TRINITY_DN4092_c0_g1_i1.p1 TRINITY_DN4092_c0_g1~~TRINITY_DN4092_c0_g1_i1.p1  ORF type:complete len:820 (+),score=172.63 TRINITY_DN4092_c0_g1_i1:46-2460(+)